MKKLKAKLLRESKERPKSGQLFPESARVQQHSNLSSTSAVSTAALSGQEFITASGTSQRVSSPSETHLGSQTTSSHDNDLWYQAYEKLKEREPELTADYEKHLAQLHGGASISNPKSVESIVKTLLEARQKKQWRVSLVGQEVKIREQAEKLAKFLLWTDPIVKNALSSQPYAALAWSGVSILLPVRKLLKLQKHGVQLRSRTTSSGQESRR